MNKYDVPGLSFTIASISKTFTATAIMKLVEQGKLQLQDKVFGIGGILGTTYGTYPYKKWVKVITVEDLLAHLGGGWTDAGYDKNHDLYNDRDPMFLHPELNQAALISWALDNQPLKYEPGTHLLYSNFGFCLLGRVIEKVTGMKYEEYARKNILQPGGWIATPTDLVKFIMRVDKFPQKADILELATLDTMFSPPPVSLGSAKGWTYAKGWAVDKYDNYIHAGAFPGQHAICGRGHDYVYFKKPSR
jgi:hypothetical protein